IHLHASPHPTLYPLSLHDALPISAQFTFRAERGSNDPVGRLRKINEAALRRPLVHLPICRRQEYSSIPTGGHRGRADGVGLQDRSEEHTSELQSHLNLVCRLLLEK